MKIREITESNRKGRGPSQGWSNYCKNTARDNMSASWRSSCIARGLLARNTGKTQLIGKKRVKLGGKRLKSQKHGGPVSPTRTG